jgi:hypothetical protein
MRLAGLLGSLAITAGGLQLTVLPRPSFPGPAGAPSGPHRLELVSSVKVGVSNVVVTSATGPSLRGLPPQTIFQTANRRFVLYGKDGASGRYVVAYPLKGAEPLYGFDFASYAWPPRIKPGDREFVYEQPQWAQELNDVLYVETAHLTYAVSSYGQNAYITAINVETGKVLWRSAALVANALNFVVTPKYVIAGYGFTNEPDYLYLLDRGTGRVLDRLLLPNGPEKITRRGNLLHVRTYDHAVTVRLTGA